MTSPDNMAVSHAGSSEPADVLQQAAEWFAHLHSGEVAATDYDAFDRWKAVHPERAVIYDRLAALWSGVAAVDTQAGKATLAVMLAPPKRKDRLQKTGAGVLVMMLCALTLWLGLQAEYPGYYLADHRSHTGEQRKLQLADQSEVTLDTHSAINVSFNTQQRTIELVKGALFIDVAKDTTRPLIIETPFGSAQALGTQFAVEKDAHAMRVSVRESHVKVCAKERRHTCVTLAPGESVQVWADHISPVIKINPWQEFAWVNGYLLADDVPLNAVLERLSHYQAGKLVYDAEALSAVRVSGVFKLTEVEQALAHISATVPIRVETYTTYLTIVRPE
jgi:transmembrane sensor